MKIIFTCFNFFFTKLQGVCLTNRIVNDNNIEQNDDFWILCETLIENPIEIDDINVFTQENYETFIRDKDCLILSNDQKKNNRDDHYLLWKGKDIFNVKFNKKI